MSDEQDKEAQGRAAAEVVEAALAKMRATLGRKPAPGRYKVERTDPPPPCLSDVGHGDRCVCEVCWQMRLREVFPGSYPITKSGAKVELRGTAPGVPESATTGVSQSAQVAPTDAVPSPAPRESKLDLLKRLFPL